jgi:hypothetical protein
MYRYNEGTEYVVDVTNVELAIPTVDDLTDEQKENELLVQYHTQFKEWIAQGNTPLEQLES